MKGNYPYSSALWDHINKSYITEDHLKDLTCFKSSIVNYKISFWNPHTNGIRYLKTLIFNLCTTMTEKNWRKIKQIKNRDVGNPITVKYDNEDICLDYIQALYEMQFIEENLLINLSGRRILEIGAGYGRTCHAILSNHDVESYYIIDLENCLTLSNIYLQKVLDPDMYQKVHFVLASDIDKIEDVFFDLCINIDSFAEIDPIVVKYYLRYIDQHTDFFYVKNPVGKYQDPTITELHNKEEIKLALCTGLLRDIIDINDNVAVKLQSGEFVKVYAPDTRWQCIANAWSPPWSYYWQALYKRYVEEVESP